MPFEGRRLDSASELRALSHPTRLALIRLLDDEGPLTATEAGERLGESPANASFHLRTLAKYGHVEEAPGGRGRQRPWQVVHRANSIPNEDLTPEARIAAGALIELIRARDLQQLREWDATRADYPKEWREAANEMRLGLHLTAAELTELNAAIEELVSAYEDRTDPRRPGALPVSLGLHAVPTRLPRDDPSTEER